MPIIQILLGWLLMIIVVLVLLGLAAVAMVSLFKGWIPIFWASIVAAIGVVCAVICSVLVVESIPKWFPGDFPFLTTPPIENDLFGSYVLDKRSAAMLKKKGYTNLNAEIVLNKDKTLIITNMPHLWLFGSDYRPGYDNCTGPWHVQKLPGRSGQYIVNVHSYSYSSNSAMLTDPVNGVWNLTPFLGIAAKTKGRSDYALAVELNNGDEGALLFVKTMASPRGSESTGSNSLKERSPEHLAAPAR
jgi:hypothetical protein